MKRYVFEAKTTTYLERDSNAAARHGIPCSERGILLAVFETRRVPYSHRVVLFGCLHDLRHHFRKASS